MAATNSAVAVFHTHAKAEEAVRELQRSGFDMKKLSIVGKDYHTGEHVVGYYNTGDRMMYWGKVGALWGGFWSLLFGSAFFAIPGLGPVLVRGPADDVDRWWSGRCGGGWWRLVEVGGVSALGAALMSIGIPNNRVLKYETELKNGKLLLLVHGTPDEVEHAKDILQYASVTTTVYAKPAVVAT